MLPLRAARTCWGCSEPNILFTGIWLIISRPSGGVIEECLTCGTKR